MKNAIFYLRKLPSQLGVMPVAGKREQICTLGSFPLVQSLSRLLVPPPLGTGRCFKVSPKPPLPQEEQPQLLSLPVSRSCFKLACPSSKYKYRVACCLFGIAVFTEIFNHWNNLHTALVALPSLEFLIISICPYLSILLSTCKSH